MVFDQVVDVVVIGTGASGCAAALAAAQSGLSVVQLEKTMALGGTTAESYGLLWVPGLGDADSSAAAHDVDEAVTYLRFLSAGRLSDGEARRYCVGIGEAIDF